MNYQIFDVTNLSEKCRQQDTCKVINRFFWSILLFFSVIFIVLFMLIVYFGTNQIFKDDSMTISNRVAQIKPRTTTGPHINVIRSAYTIFGIYLYNAEFIRDLLVQVFT